MIDVFNVEYNDVKLEPAEIEKFIGFTDKSTPEHFSDIIEDVLNDLEHYVDIIGGYLISAVTSIEDKNEIIISEKTFSPGKLITARLKDAEEIAIVVCTVGKGITDKTSEYSKKGKIIHSYICDSAGSILVEKAMDLIQQQLREKVLREGKEITNRYSPGYCEWNVSEQQKLFSILPDKFCGITLSESSLMNPIKSVSGFIGIGKNVKYRKHDCEMCKMDNCVYRNK